MTLTGFRRAKCPRCGAPINQVWFEKAGRIWAYFIAECNGKKSEMTGNLYQGWHVFRIKVRLAEPLEAKPS